MIIMTPQIYAGLPTTHRSLYQVGTSSKLQKIVINQIEAEIGVPFSVIKSTRRTHEVVIARQILCHIFRTVFKLSFKTIGRMLNRDHSTIIYSVNEAENRILYDREFKELYEMAKKHTETE